MFMSPMILAAVAVTGLAIHLYRRLAYLRLHQFAHLPQAKPSLLWGHIRIMGALMDAINSGRGRRTDACDDMFMSLFQDNGNPEVLFVDTRPFMMPMLVIRSHAVAEQISRQSKVLPYSADKTPTLSYLRPLIGETSIISINGHKWKSLRRRFNPGFAPQHLMSLMPLITDMSRSLIHNLDSFARSGEVCTLNPLFTNLTLDIIGIVAANLQLRAQQPKEEQHELVPLFTELLSTFSQQSGATPWWTEPRTRLKRWRLEKPINACLRRHVTQETLHLRTSGKASRSVLDLSLQDTDTLADTTLSETVDQLKSFLFAGHDTTSHILQWAIHDTSRHPRVLAALRAEADRVLGTDADPAALLAAFADRPDDTLRAMPYAHAVIKESLRRHATGGSGRYVPPGTNLRATLSSGASLPLDGLVLFLCHDLIMLDESTYGPTAHDFIPERWLPALSPSATGGLSPAECALVSSASGADIPVSAYRPFERGPRNCIGQELALLEARMILPLVVRRYDFVKVGLGEATLGEDGRPIVDERGRHVAETELYSVRQGTAGPVDGVQTRVSFREGFGS